MEPTALLLFAAAVFVSAWSPGPSIAALVTRVLIKGWRDVMPFLAAMWIGETVWLTCAVAGLVVLMDSFYWVFQLVKYCGVAYLAYLAWRMWTAPTELYEAIDTDDVNRGRMRMFFAGLAITLGNPKLMVFYLALLPTIIDLQKITVADWSGLTVVMLLIIVMVDCAYVFAAAKARSLLKSKRSIRFANKLGATVMGGAAIAISSRQ